MNIFHQYLCVKSDTITYLSQQPLSHNTRLSQHKKSGEETDLFLHAADEPGVLCAELAVWPRRPLALRLLHELLVALGRGLLLRRHQVQPGPHLQTPPCKNILRNWGFKAIFTCAGLNWAPKNHERSISFNTFQSKELIPGQEYILVFSKEHSLMK